MAAQLATILAPVFITIAVGFGWAKSGATYDNDFITKLVMNIGAPCLVFSALTSADIDGAALSSTAGAITLCILSFTLIGAAGLRLAGLSTRAYLPSLVFPNIGNMGLPVAMFTFGAEGLAFGIATMATMITLTWTLGMWLASGRLDLKKALLNPAMLAIALAVLTLTTGQTPPKWLADSTQLIGSFTIPIMLLTLGANLATLKVARLPISIAIGASRILMGFCVGFAIVELLGLTGAARGVVLIQASMPSAVFNFLFARLYGERPEEVAGVIMTSTGFSLISLPLIVGFVLATS